MRRPAVVLACTVLAVSLAGCASTQPADVIAPDPLESPAASVPAAQEAPSAPPEAAATPAGLGGQEAVVAAAAQDPSVGPALAAGQVVRVAQTADGAWAVLEATTAAEGLVVLLRSSGQQWQVVDAGGAGAGCPFVPAAAASDLGLGCGNA